jgi:N-dimethylarginine dimethylaminohydrolase
MCPPTSYSIRYEINPWMNVKNQADRALAVRQWKNLKRALERRKVRVELIRPSRRQPDMVFTANAGVAHERVFVPSNFRYPQRQGERELFINYFKKKKYRVMELEPSLRFEGEGDMLSFGDVLIGGWHYRSDIQSHEAVSGLLRRSVVSLELSNPHFYHLDTCFAPLDERHALYFPGAFDRRGEKLIQEFVPSPIPVTSPEAFAMCCNAFTVGRTVFMHRATPRLKILLSQARFEVEEVSTSEFIKAGGSVKCMVLRLP